MDEFHTKWWNGYTSGETSDSALNHTIEEVLCPILFSGYHFGHQGEKRKRKRGDININRPLFFTEKERQLLLQEVEDGGSYD
jgi:hypothetical protein